MLDVLTESGCVDERALCIAPFRLAWALYIDLICLNHDGNVQDACVLAMISALKTLKLPEVNWIVDESAGELNDDSGQVRVKDEPTKRMQLLMLCFLDQGYISAQDDSSQAAVRTGLHDHVCHSRRSRRHFALGSQQTGGGVCAHVSHCLHGERREDLAYAEVRCRSWLESGANGLVY